MSRILSRISIFTGQISSQALHEVQAQTSSGVTRSKRELAETVISATTPSGGETCGVPVAAITSPDFRTISRGSSDLPVACAGHTDVQRPHMVQASRSSNCFQVKSSMVETPNDSSSVSMRFGIGFIAPLGRSRSFKYMFSGEVNMCRSIVTGRITRKAKNESTWRIHHTWCPPARLELFSMSLARGQPTNDHFSNEGIPVSAMRHASVPKPVTVMARKTPRMTACSGLDLMRMRYGRWT